MSKIKNIIFDLDGTLWDSREQIIEAWKNVIPDININAKDLDNLMGKTNAEYIKFLFPNFSDKEAEKLMKKCEIEEVKYLTQFGAKLYDNIIPIIKDLSKSYKLFRVSNGQKGYIESFLYHYNLIEFFLDTEFNGNTNKLKEENIKLLMNRNNLKQNQTCYIGDTQSDYNASLNNNIEFIWCRYGFGKFPNYEKYVNKPEDISCLIRTLD